MIKIYGLSFNETEEDGRRVWKVHFDKEPFYFKGNRVLGFSEKAIRSAQNSGVYQFIAHTPTGTYHLNVPTDLQLKTKKKNKEYEKRESIFPNGEPIIIYYLIVK